MPSWSIQCRLVALSGPILTEAANGTSANCTGLLICFISAAWPAIVSMSCLAAVLEEIDALLAGTGAGLAHRARIVEHQRHLERVLQPTSEVAEKSTSDPRPLPISWAKVGKK